MRGTAAEGEPLANAEVIIRDVNGNTLSTTTNAQGKYNFNNINGLTAPLIIKVRKDAVKSFYSVLPSVEQNKMNIANVHTVSDVAARNWFKQNGDDIDDFDGDDAITNPPTDDDINDLVDALVGLLRFAYEDFEVTDGFDFIRDDFNANGMGFDGLLDNATIVINDNKVTIKVKDPETGFEGKIIIKFDMNLDLGQEDTLPPSEPTGLLVVPASSSEMVIVWDASTDNIGVAGYHVYWGSDENVSDGSTTVPYPVFKHEGLMAGQQYCYAVQAVDGNNNTSSVTTVDLNVHCKQTQADDGNPPDAPTNLRVTDSGLGSINLEWDAPVTNTDIIGYRIYRAVAGDIEVFHAATLLTNFEDIAVVEGVEYCYSVAAVDAAFNESARSNSNCGVPTKTALDVTPPVTEADPPGNTYPVAQSVELRCTDGVDGSGCFAIHYTTDGTPPTISSPQYGGPIMIGGGKVLIVQAAAITGRNDRASGSDHDVFPRLHVLKHCPRCLALVIHNQLNRRSELEHGNILGPGQHLVAQRAHDGSP